MQAAAQSTELTILVDGSPVALSRPAERVGREWFVPLASVARALAIDIEPAPEIGGLRARSGTVGEILYDGRTGEIRYGGLLIATVQNFRQIVLAGPLESVLFPASGIVPLLGVDVSEDVATNVMRIEPAGGLLTDGLSAPAFRFAGLDYAVGVTAGEREVGHYTALRGDAVASNVALSSTWLLNGQGSAVGVRQGLVQADFGHQRVVGLGDQASRTSVDALQTSFRGLAYRSPLGAGVEVDVYGGKAVGSTRASFGTPGIPTFDSNVAGAGARRRFAHGEVSLSSYWFDGAERSGTSVGAAFVQISSRNQLRIQTVFGRFSGLSAGATSTAPFALASGPLGTTTASLALDMPAPVVTSRLHVEGTAVGVSVLDTFTASRLSVTAQVEQYGRNFLTAREDSQFNAQRSRRLTGSVRPFAAASLFAGIDDRTFLLGDRTTTRSLNYGGQARVPYSPLQLAYFASSRIDAAATAASIDLSQYSASIFDLRRYSGSVYYTVATFGDQVTRNVTTLVSKEFGRRGRLSAHGQFQLDSSQRLGLEWEQQIPAIGGSLRMGLERTEQRGGDRGEYVPRTLLAFTLPSNQLVNLSYSGERGGRTLSVSLSGPVARRRDIERRPDGRAVIAPNATLTGRVYFDGDSDGSFGSVADRGLPEVTVWLDDNTSRATDVNGVFLFDLVAPGAHPVRAELDGVPADLVFAENPERTIAVRPYGQTTQNFRVVRTGTLTARVTFLENEGPAAPVEHPLADVRVIASEQHDALTDGTGSVILAALPPGSYELRLDPDTIPAGYSAAPIHVDLKAGESVRDLRFVLTRIPREIIRRELSRQQQ